MAKLMKNNTAVSRAWVGQVIDPGQYYTLQHVEEPVWADDPNVFDSIDNGDLIVNNGFEDILNLVAAHNFLAGVKRIAFTMSSKPLGDSANSASFATVASYLWLKNRGYNYTNGQCIFDAVTVIDRTLEIQVVNVTGSVVLGSMIVSTPGFYSFAITNPTADARLELQIRKSASGGTSPVIRGAALEYDLA